MAEGDDRRPRGKVAERAAGRVAERLAGIEQPQWRRDPATGRWWPMTSADMIRLERETPSAEELGRRAGQTIAGDSRQTEYVKRLLEGLIRPRS